MEYQDEFQMPGSYQELMNYVDSIPNPSMEVMELRRQFVGNLYLAINNIIWSISASKNADRDNERYAQHNASKAFIAAEESLRALLSAVLSSGVDLADVEILMEYVYGAIGARPSIAIAQEKWEPVIDEQIPPVVRTLQYLKARSERYDMEMTEAKIREFHESQKSSFWNQCKNLFGM